MAATHWDDGESVRANGEANIDVVHEAVRRKERKVTGFEGGSLTYDKPRMENVGPVGDTAKPTDEAGQRAQVRLRFAQTCRRLTALSGDFTPEPTTSSPVTDILFDSWALDLDSRRAFPAVRP